MEQIASIEQIRSLIAQIRDRRQGFVTNFYLDEEKHNWWIRKGLFFYACLPHTLFLVKQSPDFWNVFYCSTTKDELGEDVRAFQQTYPDKKWMVDIVGREHQCVPMIEMFENQGFCMAASLVRMFRANPPAPSEELVDAVVKASANEAGMVSSLLSQYFDATLEQLPLEEELMDYAQNGQVLLCRLQNQIAGFLVFERNSSTLYLRYWFTHPDFRDQRVGSRLLRVFFAEGKNVQRQLLWVIRNNENAIKRYKHYGFQEENMFDYVMTNHA